MLNLSELEFGDVTLRINKKYTLRAKIEKEYDRLLISFPYNAAVKDEIKAMQGCRWHGYDDPNPRKIWSVQDTLRNRFQLAYLMDLDPYAPYNAPLIQFNGSRVLYSQQKEIGSHVLTRRQCIIAGEMGIGKTLSIIEAMEAMGLSGYVDQVVYWVGPRAAIYSVRYEFWKWKAKLTPRFMTYEEMKKVMVNWQSGDKAPQWVIFDECQKLKNPTSQRSQAAQHLADSIRIDHGRDGFIILMSGTPAPKDPSDWYSLSNIACPGFLKEGTYDKFKNRLALIERYESLAGGSFPKLVTWWDDEHKCGKCGKLNDDPNHDVVNLLESWYHPFKASVNEVNKLYQRMKGLVIVKFKKDCLADLPEKVYRIIKCKPSSSTLRAASLITKTATSAIKAITLCRELSDGFQYVEIEDGTEKCPNCGGIGAVTTQVDADDPDNPLDSESLSRGHRAIWVDQDNERDDEGNLINNPTSRFSRNDQNRWILKGFMERPLRIKEQVMECYVCNGTRQVPKYIRTAERAPCPKDDAIVDLLEEYEDIGRAIIWAGFTDAVDRNVETCLKQNWTVLRIDGRGWWCSDFNLNLPGPDRNVNLLRAFDNTDKYPKMVVVGQPGAGGIGLNLTASPMAVYYSNTNKGEDRSQSEDRIHRPGADINKGCTIYDLIHLPQDLVILNSLKRKRDLESMTMGILKSELEKALLDNEERDY